MTIPNCGDALVSDISKTCADRRPNLHSNRTTHSSDRFYVQSAIGSEDQEWDSWDDDDEVLNKAEHSITCESVDDLLEIVQLFLAFHSFYKYGCSLYGISGFQKIDERVRDMMDKLQKSVDRGEGTLGWCVSKFHDTLHMALDMQLFGSSENSDTSKGEHGLKVWAKLPSKTAQVNHGANQFITQISKRLYEQTLLDKATSILVPRYEATVKLRAPLEYAKFVIDRQDGSCFQCNGKLKKHKKQELVLRLDIQDWLVNKQTQITRNTVVVYSQLYLKGQDIMFRASPNFRKTGAWYDWVLVNFISSAEEVVQYPFKILGFVAKDNEVGQLCFGQMCSTQNASELQRSRIGLFEHWHLETRTGSQEGVYRFVELNTIESSCLAIQLSANSFNTLIRSNDTTNMFHDFNLEFSNKVIIVKDRKTVWPKIFLNGLKRLKKHKTTKRR